MWRAARNHASTTYTASPIEPTVLSHAPGRTISHSSTIQTAASSPPPSTASRGGTPPPLRPASPTCASCAARACGRSRFSTSRPMMITVKRPGENRRDVEHVLVLVDEPAEAAGARGGAEHELCGDQRAPGEGPADLEPRQDARERGGNEDLAHVADAAEAVVAPDHAQRGRHAEEARMRVERDRPHHRVHEHEDDARVAEARARSARAAAARSRAAG